MVERLIPLRVLPSDGCAEGPGRGALRTFPVRVGIEKDIFVETYVGPFSRLERYDWADLDELRAAEREAVRSWLEGAIGGEKREAERRRARREQEIARARECIERCVPADDLSRLDEAAVAEHEARNRVRMRGGKTALPDHPHTRRWNLPLFQGFFRLDHPAGASSFASMSASERERAYREFRRRVERWEWGQVEGGRPGQTHAHAFRLLGLAPDASLSQVKRRFRELARVFHPDMPSGDTEKMKQIAAAYSRIVKGRSR